MKTYSFDELSTDAQENAIGLYWADAEIMAWGAANPDTDGTDALAIDALPRIGWRFNSKGERI